MNNADLFDLFGPAGDEPPKPEGEAPTRFLPPNPAPPGEAAGLLPAQPLAGAAVPLSIAPPPDLFGASGLTGFSPVAPMAAPQVRAAPQSHRPATPAPKLRLPDLPPLPDLLALAELPPLPELPAFPVQPELSMPAQAPAPVAAPQAGAGSASTPKTGQAAGTAGDALRRESHESREPAVPSDAASAARQPAPQTTVPAAAAQPATPGGGASRAMPPAPPQATPHGPPLVGVDMADDTAEDGDDFWSGPAITPLPQPVFSPKAAPGPALSSGSGSGSVPPPELASPRREPAPLAPQAAQNLPGSSSPAPQLQPAPRALPPEPPPAARRVADEPMPSQTHSDGEWSDWPPVDASDDWSPMGSGDEGGADSWIDELPPPSAADWGDAPDVWPGDGEPVWDEADQFNASLASEPVAKPGPATRAKRNEEDAQLPATAQVQLDAPRPGAAAQQTEPAAAPEATSASGPKAAQATGTAPQVEPPQPTAPAQIKPVRPDLSKPVQPKPTQQLAQNLPEPATHQPATHPPAAASLAETSPVAEPKPKPKAAPLGADALTALGDLPAADLAHPQAQAHVRQHLRAWVASEQLRELDLALADFLLELEPQMPPLALLGAVLASHQLGRGHVCLDLGACLSSGARTLAWRRLPAPEGVRAVSDIHRQISGGSTVILGQDVAGDQVARLAVDAKALAGDAGASPHEAQAAGQGADQSTDAALAFADPAQLLGAGSPTGIEPVTPADEPAMLPTPMDWLDGVSLAQWQAALLASSQVLPAAGASPLVLQGARLYLRRQWQDEHSVRAAIVARVGQAAQLRQRWATPRWQAALDALFDAPSAGKPKAAGMDWQRAACALAASQGFCIITGGPGTGKTTTVVKLLALLQAMALAPRDDQSAAGEGAAPSAGQPLRIALAAPTGKAAARLGESISGALQQLKLDTLAQVLDVPGVTPARDEGAPAPKPLTGAERLLAAIPSEALTLHRLLGPRANSRHFWHHAHNPLPVDVLVVDEASMVDLDMMARLMAALPPGARLVLLGDKDQLASVEAGAVLGELCSRAQQGHFSPATVDWLQAVTGQQVPADLRDAQGTPLDQAVVMLRHSHRFGAHSGIGELAKAVNLGQVRAVTRLRLQPPADLQWLAVANAQAPELAQLLLEGQLSGQPSSTELDEHGRLRERQGYAHYLRVMHAGMAALPALDEAALSEWAKAVLKAHQRFQLLCALREGPWGVSGLNRRIARVLAGAGLIAPQGSWWAGRPVMVTGNDYGLGLMNGDIGVCLQRPDRLAVAFADATRDGGVRWVAPSRLAQVETVFAMTVHKSQGSEFAHTALAIPPQWNPVLTRELVYTGITRASQWCAIVLAGAKGDAVLDMAVKRRVLRASGLLADV